MEWRYRPIDQASFLLDWQLIAGIGAGFFYGLFFGLLLQFFLFLALAGEFFLAFFVGVVRFHPACLLMSESGGTKRAAMAPVP